MANGDSNFSVFTFTLSLIYYSQAIQADYFVAKEPPMQQVGQSDRNSDEREVVVGDGEGQGDCRCKGNR